MLLTCGCQGPWGLGFLEKRVAKAERRWKGKRQTWSQPLAWRAQPTWACPSCIFGTAENESNGGSLRTGAHRLAVEWDVSKFWNNDTLGLHVLIPKGGCVWCAVVGSLF